MKNFTANTIVFEDSLELSGNSVNICKNFSTYDSPAPLSLFEMFAGYGGASFALKKAGIPFKCVGYSEIDKFAIQCYEQNHGDIRNFGDCTKIIPEDLPDFDLLTAGFPCQPFSMAGKGLGEQDIRGTLFHDIIRIAEFKKPRWMLLENVRGLTFKKHKKTFNKILSELDRIGYFVHYKILNSKEHGIPQNRERIFFACFRNEAEYSDFQFQEKEELRIFLKDILEEDVDEKYYLNRKQIDRLIAMTNVKLDVKGVGCFDVYNKKIKTDGFTPTLMTNSTRQLIIKTNTNKGYDIAVPGDGIRLEQPNSKTARGRVLKQLSGTLMCNAERGVLTENLRIRKLTPKEYFRLMGFLNDEINLEGIPNTQKYKLAGNGWCIQTVSKIFAEIFKYSKSSAIPEFEKAA